LASTEHQEVLSRANGVPRRAALESGPPRSAKEICKGAVPSLSAAIKLVLISIVLLS